MFDSVQLLGFDLHCSLALIHSLYVISVRQTRVLPPSSFRFHLTMDTLDFGCILPTVGRIRDFHPLETCAAERTMNKPDACKGVRFFYSMPKAYLLAAVAGFSFFFLSVLHHTAGTAADGEQAGCCFQPW